MGVFGSETTRYFVENDRLGGKLWDIGDINAGDVVIWGNFGCPSKVVLEGDAARVRKVVIKGKISVTG